MIGHRARVPHHLKRVISFRSTNLSHAHDELVRTSNSPRKMHDSTLEHSSSWLPNFKDKGYEVNSLLIEGWRFDVRGPPYRFARPPI